MDQNWLVHGTWLAGAIASFLIGSHFPSAGGTRASSRPASEAGQLEGIPGQASADRPARSLSPSIVLGAVSSGQLSIHLSEREIELLGKKFRSSNPIERRLAFAELLQGLTSENALLIRKQIEHLDDKSPEYREFHYAWGAVAGVDAVVFGAGTPGDDMSPTLAGWASNDPQAARAWLEALDMVNDPAFDNLLNDRKIPADALRFHLMRGLVSGMANSDPTMASQFVHELVASGDRAAAGLIHQVVESVLRSGSPTEAAAWVGGMTDDRLRRASMEHVAAVFADKDIEAATGWAATVAGRPEAAGAVAQVGARIARRDPQSAVAWLSDLPAGDGQNAGMHRVMREWTDRDPTAASEYLTSMPDSPAKDSAIGGLSQRLASEDPQSAVAWAETIGSDAKRRESLISAGQAWNQKDPDAAAEWLGSANLPEETRQAILTLGNPR